MIWAFVVAAILVFVFGVVYVIKTVAEHERKAEMDAAWIASQPPPKNPNETELE